jgi:hypothetical protein
MPSTMSADSSPHLPTPAPIREWRNVDAEIFRNEIATRYEPAILRGLVADWPAVALAGQPPERTRDYLARFDSGVPVKAMVAPPEVDGRFFFTDDMSGFNFGRVETRVTALATELIANSTRPQKLSIYAGSLPIARTLPGFERENALPLLRDKHAEPKIWIGGKTRIAAHYDEADNIAAVVRGKRRFTLFPPAEIVNLYPGPIDQTVAGQPTSMVDLAHPDFEKYPRFRDALAAARFADLEPGDAIFIPSLWWHHVQSEGDFNLLVNYWWSDAPPDAGSPLHALGHGILTIAHLPEPQREAWRALFDHWVFKRGDDPAAHLPPARQGIHGQSTPQLRTVIRQFLVRMLQGR